MGDRVVHGWNPAGYAALLGVAYRDAARFTPADLAARLDRVLESCQRLVERFDSERLDHVPAERKRTVRDLAFHVYRVALSFIDAVDRNELPEAWFEERAPLDLVSGADVARYAALVRGRIAGWFEGAGGDEFRRTVMTYYGPQAADELLERTVWHAGQHLRQLYVLAERLGVVPPAPLPVEALRGLPLPEAIW
ncbi:MAG TPA: DinB family protein [Methylomirabilota bacterium]|nr:DinB family protein [Methylomirabilota bacterium]